MSLGIVMKGLNSLHFRNRLDFFFEFIPQFLLLFALFGWMDILILGKWMTPKNIENIFLNPCPPKDDPNR
jgi:V-type H+-transporting ATPase subunit a